jgi:hypothetical protein
MDPSYVRSYQFCVIIRIFYYVNELFFRKFRGEFFSHLLKWVQPRCSHQELNPSGELSSQWSYHCTTCPFALLSFPLQEYKQQAVSTHDAWSILLFFHIILKMASG